MGELSRVWLKDGRAVAGNIICVDYLKNVILANAVELKPAFSDEYALSCTYLLRKSKTS